MSHIIVKYIPPDGGPPPTILNYSLTNRVLGGSEGLYVFLASVRYLYATKLRSSLVPNKIITKAFVANLLKGYRDPDGTTYGFEPEPEKYRQSYKYNPNREGVVAVGTYPSEHLCSVMVTDEQFLRRYDTVLMNMDARHLKRRTRKYIDELLKSCEMRLLP